MGAHNRLRDHFSGTTDEVHRRARKDDGGILDLECSLHRSVVAYGSGSEQTCGVATALVLTYNHLAMKRLSENNIKDSLRLLQKAKLLTDRHQGFLGKGRLQARALTLNNTGCLMKKWGKPRESVKLLARALRIEAEVPEGADNPAGTHVNMSAALSTLGLHRAAAAHASHAIHLASQAMRQGEESTSSFVAAGGCTRLNGCVDYADPKCMDVCGAASFNLPSGGNGRNSVRHSRGGGESGSIGSAGSGDFPTTAVEENAESGSGHEPILDGPETGMVPSAVADDGRSSEASSLSSSVNRAGQEVQGNEKEEEKIPTAFTQDYADGQSVPLEGSSVKQEKSKNRKITPSAAGALLAIAYFNLGVEQEHLGQLDVALSSYQDARAAAVRHLGPDNPVARGIEIALEKASDAAVVFAFESRKRSASRSRSAVSSFPSIGKLQFGYKTPNGLRRIDERIIFPRRRQRHQQPHGGGAPGYAAGRDLLEQAYTSPRPCPPPPRTGSWARLGHMLSPRSPPVGSASPPGAGIPQRSGRWTDANNAAAVVPPDRQQRPRVRGSGARGGSDQELWWRALACSEWKCSPREALQAQQTAERERSRKVEAVSPAGGGIQR